MDYLKTTKLIINNVDLTYKYNVWIWLSMTDFLFLREEDTACTSLRSVFVWEEIMDAICTAHSQLPYYAGVIDMYLIIQSFLTTYYDINRQNNSWCCRSIISTLLGHLDNVLVVKSSFTSSTLFKIKIHIRRYEFREQICEYVNVYQKITKHNSSSICFFNTNMM